MLLSNRLTYCITTFILLVAFAVVPVMAHMPGAGHDAAHDGESPDPDTDLNAETDHTHSAAPTITSIVAVDTMGSPLGTATPTADTLVSNVDGSNVVLAATVDTATADRLLVTVGTGGVFQVKVTFSGPVHGADSVAGSTAVPTIGETDLAATAFRVIAAYADAPEVALTGAGAASVTAVTRVVTSAAGVTPVVYSLTEFLVTVTVAANAELDPADTETDEVKAAAAAKRPLSVWLGVEPNSIYTKANLNNNGEIVQGRGNLESGNEKFSVNNYVAPTDPPTPDTVGPDITTFDAPSAVDADGNLVFTLTFDQSLGARGLLVGDFDVDGGTVIEVTPSGAATTYMVKVDPTSTNPDETEVIVTLKDNAVTDDSGNSYTAPDTPTRGIFDNVNPTVNAVAAGVVGTGTGTGGNGIAVGMVKLSITFSEELGSGAGGFMHSDIDRINSNVLLTNTDPILATMPEGNKTIWELTVTPVPANAGQVVIVITAGSVMDMAGNDLLQDTIVTWTRPGAPGAETDKPVVTIALPSGMTYIDSVSGGMVMITATDNTAVTNAVMDAEISVTNATKGNIANNQISVMPNVAATSVTVTVAAGAAMDAAGNGSDAVSETFNVGPIFTVPAGNGNANPGYLVITKSTAETHQYLSDQPTIYTSPQETDPPTPVPDIMFGEWSNMPDLERLFNTSSGSGGTLNIKAAATNVDAMDNQVSTANVRITEVMWAIDESMRGAQDDAEADDQWVEVENPNTHDVKIIIYARTGVDSATTHIGNPDGHIDRIGNAYNGGPGSARWGVPGSNGNSYTGEKHFTSMWRRYVGNNRGKGYQNGTASGAWSASGNIYLTSQTMNPNDGALYNHIGTPGRLQSVTLPRPSTRAGTTNVPSSPVIINEVANRQDGDRQYEWIELKNVTGNEVNLRNWMISVVRGTDDDKPMIQFPNNDNTKILPNGVILLLASDPRFDDDHPIAVGYNVDVNANDQVDGLGLNVPGSNRQPPRQRVITFANGGLPDGGDYILILRKKDGNQGSRSGGHGGEGVAETGGADIDKIIDVAGSHRGLDKSNYPGTTPAGLNNTTLWPLVNFSGHNRPHYGHGDLNHRRHNRLEVNRVRYRQHVKTTARNDADGSDGVNRAGTGVTHKNEGVEHYAFRDAIYTGLGYKRTARATGIYNGTPGYDGNSIGNTGIVKATADKVSVAISEIMPSTGPNADNPVYPQWIELFNSSPTDAVNLRNWKLRFETLDADGNPMNLMDLGFNSSRSVKTIQPQQTVLIVAGNARQANSDSATGIDVFNENRVFNVYRDVGAGKFGANTRYMFFNPTAFSIALLDKDNKVVDHIGNLDGDNRTSDTNAWDFPMGVAADDNRTSFIRVYDNGVARTGVNTSESNVMPIFKEGGKRNDTDGIDMKYSWIPAVNTEREFKVTIKSTWYGDEDDYGTPGHRVGLVLPVQLSFFRPTLEDGVVTIRWTTESELDNAGFNIYRSEARDGEFKQVNSELIEGAGTTGERSTYNWVDQTAKPGVIYYYQIEDVSFAGERQPLAITKLKGLISAKNKLTTTWSELKEASQ